MMVRSSTLILGFCLGVLAFLGWINPDGTGWLSALDLIGAFWAFLLSTRSTYNLPSPESERVLSGGPILLGIGLIITWILAFSNPLVVKWQAWWTFGLGCASIVVGLANLFFKGLGRRRRPLTH